MSQPIAPNAPRSNAPAMILAAGRGTRMQPHEARLPKPLVPIAGKPLLRHALDVVERSQLSHCVVNSHHKAEQIEAYLRQQSFPITLSYEAELLETGGGIRHALPLLAECFFTLNSDVICVENLGDQPVLQRLQQGWKPGQMDGLLLLCPLSNAHGYQGSGDFSLDAEGRLMPVQPGQPAYVYMGIQYLHRRFITQANMAESAFSLSPLYRAELAKGNKGRLFGLIHQGSWLHVGDPAGVAAAENFLNVAA